MTTTTGPEGRTPEQIDLAVRTFAHIETHPDEWDQSTWRCETGMCFAGHAALLAGAQWADPRNPRSPYVALPEGHPLALDGLKIVVSEYAEWALGLDPEEAADLFYHNNNLEDLRRMVTAIQNREQFA